MLLLQATSNTGPGAFAEVVCIQRLETEGGVSPNGSYTTDRTVSVPHQATYELWAPAK